MKTSVLSNISSFFKTESSQDALRNILAILIPSIILFQIWDGHIAIAFATGTLLSALTDLPGNKRDKLITAAYCIPIFLVTSLSSALALFYDSWSIVILLGIFGFFYTIIALLSFRVNVVGNLGLIVASFTIGLRPENPLVFSLSVTLGVVFFFMICLLQAYLSPGRSLKFAFKGGIENMSKLIHLKVDCYDLDIPLAKTYKDLSALHSKVSDQLEAIRSILLRDKQLVAVSYQTAKPWLGKLYQLIELYELLMGVDNDYELIRKILKGGKSLALIRRALSILSFETSRLIHSKRKKTFRSISSNELLRIFEQLDNEAKKSNPEKATLISSIRVQLKKVSEILQVIYQSQIETDISWIESNNLKDFVAPQNGINTILRNLNFRSVIFSYAIRMAILLMIAGVFGFLLPEYRYASWIILTIILVARPSYTTTQLRNYQRIIGSMLGIAISLVILLTITNTMILISIAVIGLYLFLLFNRPNYLVCVIFITITILIGQKLYEGSTLDILGSRFAFTLLGSIFAVLGCLAIPINHFKSIEQTATSLIQNFRVYLQKIRENGESQEINYYDLRLLRKSTQASLASSYDALEQLAKDPLKGKQYRKDIQHLQTLAYRINALLVGLSINITKNHVIEWNTLSITSRINYVDILIEEAEYYTIKISQIKKRNDILKIKPIH